MDNNYDLLQLLEGKSLALREFISSEIFINFAYKVSQLVGLDIDSYIKLFDYFTVLSLQGFPVEEAEDRLNDFLPNLTEEQKKVIIREMALNLIPTLEKIWEIKPEDEEYEEKVKRYVALMEAFLNRPYSRMQVQKKLEEGQKEEIFSAPTPQIKTEEEAANISKKEAAIDLTPISWQPNVQEEKQEEIASSEFSEIPQISIKIKEEKTEEKEEKTVDLSQF
ncbi:hypothetical protein HRbin35_00270 [bacterium HR35]|nr:hypothetical protein HRbin35_00270 [bacterium HR35]